ncbi:MAG: carboxypeptidase-like regulatory domain-containing protein [Acidobacteria bacterium]|nr:carboxypeptidase-like regulatory domain-containing protein [Acidobacteriota bacterium]
MMRRCLLPALIAATLSVGASAAAGQAALSGQVIPGPPRIPPRAPDAPGTGPIVGTGVLRGHVVTADTGAPVRRAQVTATADARRRGQTTTDAEGRFEIRELPTGTYHLQVMKAGFLSPGMEQAGRTGIGPRTRIELGEGSIIEKIVIPMWRGGVISGQVTDEFGEPVAGAQVNVLRYAYRDGRRQLTPARFPGLGSASRSDDLGRFRIFGLPAGEYYVGAQPPRDFGAFSDAGPVEGLATTYFPGSPDVAQARPVRVRAAQEAPNVSFAVVRQRLARVRGTALNSRGEPFVGAMVMVGSTDSELAGFSSFGNAVRPDGSFVVTGLAPGAYNLTLRSPMQGESAELGTTRIVADGSDVDGVVIAASIAGVIRGRVTIDDGSPLPGAAAVGIFPEPVDRSVPMMGGSEAQVKQDGTFELKSLFGRCILRVSPRGGSASGLGLKAVLANGEDVTDQEIDVSSGQVWENVDIVLTRKLTHVTGTQATSGAVIIFPADEARWSARSRLLRWIPLGPEGRFETHGLPVHDDYRIVAVPPIEDGQWTDPEFLRSLVDVATRLSLIEGETKVHDLRLTRLEAQ